MQSLIFKVTNQSALGYLIILKPSDAYHQYAHYLV